MYLRATAHSSLVSSISAPTSRMMTASTILPTSTSSG
jgi:hypothetical protein